MLLALFSLGRQLGMRHELVRLVAAPVVAVRFNAGITGSVAFAADELALDSVEAGLEVEAGLHRLCSVFTCHWSSVFS